MKNYCRRCHIFEKDEALGDQIAGYIKGLPPDQCIDDASYGKRLMACEACEDLRNGLCVYCGCFVLVRAKKKIMDCPRPGGSRWL